MEKAKIRIFMCITMALILSGCATGTQYVLLGESTIPGSQAVAEANIRVSNANASGCKAVSVGGYGLDGEGTLIGIPVLVDCPAGTKLLPDGTLSP
jgi:hypothetical protein